MTQPDAFLNTPNTPPHPAKAGNLWIAGAIVLGVVFLPALLAGIVTLLMH
ncbi:MAG: hypothetical protein ACTHN5_23590 [Phycisphaerae bacterium]